MRNTENKQRWIFCPKCGHRLFRVLMGSAWLDIKCPSCKDIYVIKIDTEDEKDNENG